MAEDQRRLKWESGLAQEADRKSARIDRRGADFQTQVDRNPKGAQEELKTFEKDIKGPWYTIDATIAKENARTPKNVAPKNVDNSEEVVPRAKGGPVTKGGALWNGQPVKKL